MEKSRAEFENVQNQQKQENGKKKYDKPVFEHHDPLESVSTTYYYYYVD